ncbi:helix-turn-helix domain-containing protein [Blastomonas fulva]|uniref:helix-turn-helix domain-containing protein n=1 Tax=Blastomonas fulva TaxID=1550728 RepID=UPI003D2BE7C3
MFEQQLENSIFRFGGINAYRMPLTQELLADLVGISSVHVNRTLQQMHADNAISLVNSRLTLTDPDRLAE